MSVRRRPEPDPDLWFCSNCHVSISRAEVQRRGVQQCPAGGLLCGLCARASPSKRRARRAALEAEFADEAPVPIAPPDEASQPATDPGSRDAEFDARLGNLERSSFYMNKRLDDIVQRLDELANGRPRVE